MKRTALVFALMALTLAFTQCKKEQPSTDEGVRITLTAGYGGDRTAFTPNGGSFVWSDGITEYIYVGGSQHEACLGVLSGTGTGTGSMTFSGTLTTTPDNGEKLYFFYLGFGSERTGTALTTLDFSNQTGALDNVTNWHIAVGEGSYSDDNINYATILEMKMAIAYFDMSGFQNASNTAETVYLHGDEVYTTATVDYTTGTITGATKGYLNMGTATNGKYVALIPSVETATTLKFDSDSKTGSMTFNRGIQAKKYYSNSGAALSVTAGSLPAGTLPGIFTISATKKVRLSSGNLQATYNGSLWSWAFAPNQWSYIGSAAANTSITGNGTISGTGTVDLFGWSTSMTYFGIHNNTNHTEYTGDFVDWGTNAIGSYAANTWCTLTIDEWNYLFNSRTNASSKYAAATVNNVPGIILLPDSWILPSSCSFTAGTNGWGGNNYDASHWADMEANGAAFLPAAGSRSGTSVSDIGNYGKYCSSSPDDFGRFCGWVLRPSNKAYFGSFIRNLGFSVRLVRDL